jgi:hypothetical protein
MKPIPMQQIINLKRYDTETSILISGDDHWDGHNWERRGRNIFLYRTDKGVYFTQVRTKWQGEDDHLDAVTQDEAIALFDKHSIHDTTRVPFEEAFPGVEIEEA